MKKDQKEAKSGINRREFLKGTAAAAASTALSGPFFSAHAAKEIRVGMSLSYSGVWSTIGTKGGKRGAFSILHVQIQESGKILCGRYAGQTQRRH